MKLALGTTIVLCMLTGMPALAQTSMQTALQRSATGARFMIGDTDFRLVPDARIQRQVQAPPPDATPAMRRAGATATVDSAAAVRVGPYLILPGGAATGRRSGAAGAQDEPDLMVAINQRNGQPAVAAPRLDIFAGNAETIARVARQSNGTVLSATQDGSGIIGYASVRAALAALPRVRADREVDDASLQLIQGVATLR
ncbi:hypothetical protein A7D16_11690 [Xanthomonas nasturtii]|uniref:TonB-dependent receptor n=1 Tax=Xanthomonas nasturtii TaxID=1843581 RepID=A0A3E1KNH3_9XANT|nr:hypothetical protein [Xanthomonas nasturtii]MCL1500100.1 hypothetical protein [Xanthomonas nasturtii]MCL1503862.1 hypothetical protein [Xanthomonas nasturtii]MCL1523672.1 hypothetical protein [Xanthomonas nasturtii]MCL1528473.1 hypothetical protein [Xanthomonas nasturtii]MCL1530239.1 hypothetical protein [Xanthomonas nasturtii]